MMFGIRRSVLIGMAVLALLVMSLSAGSPVYASSGNGAIRISDSNCHDDDGYIACVTAEGVANETITPSGNAIYSGYVRTTFILSDPSGALVHEGSSTSHFQRLDQDEMLHMLSNHASSTIMMSDGTTCTFTYAVQLANGQIQFEHNVTECH